MFAGSRLVVDEDDLKWVAKEKNKLLLIKQFHDNFHCKTPRRTELGYSSERQNDALMHREGLTLSSLSLLLSSSSTTSRELLSQFSTCSE